MLLDRLSVEAPDSIREAEPAPRAAIERVHPSAYLAMLKAFCEAGGGSIAEDTVLNGASYAAAEAAAGAALAAVRHAVEGKGNAFAAIRPPGHHAYAATAQGFCLLANAVIAAREAQVLDCQNVLIVDWDVHHGNGTQALVERDPSIRFVSLHQWPWYPGSGAESERGVGNVFNVPRPPGLPPERYVADLLAAVRQSLIAWSPDSLIISAGYDSMLGDPLGGFTLEPEHYAELVAAFRDLTPAPITALLEGGYDPERVADGIMATLHALV